MVFEVLFVQAVSICFDQFVYKNQTLRKYEFRNSRKHSILLFNMKNTVKIILLVGVCIDLSNVYSASNYSN